MKVHSEQKLNNTLSEIAKIKTINSIIIGYCTAASGQTKEEQRVHSFSKINSIYCDLEMRSMGGIPSSQ